MDVIYGQCVIFKSLSSTDLRFRWIVTLPTLTWHHMELAWPLLHLLVQAGGT